VRDTCPRSSSARVQSARAGNHSHVSAATKTLFRLAAFTGCLALVVAAPATAATPTTGTTPTTVKAAKKCWNDLIRDWYDGRIDKTYPVHCYQDALKHLPTDVKTYSDAYDVISRALADATRGQKNVDPDTAVPPPGSDGTGGGGSTGTGNGTGNGSGDGGTPSAGGGPIDDVLTTGDSGANGVTIPLLVLAGLALLLVAAGGAGLLARRLQARRSGGPGTP
jgi:hypothetical protein